MTSLTTPPEQPSATPSKNAALTATYANTLPARDGSGFVDVEVVQMTARHAVWWHEKVQPLVRKHYRAHNPKGEAKENNKEVRADIRWNWKWWLRLTHLHNLSHPNSRTAPAVGLTILAIDKKGQRIPVGMLTVVPRYLCNPEHWTRKGYIWFVAGVPDEFYNTYLGRPLGGVGKALIDSAIVLTKNATGDGSMLLHASPRGGDDLVSYYESKFGFQKLTPKAAIVSPCRFVSRTEFMHLNKDQANSLLRKNKGFRVQR